MFIIIIIINIIIISSSSSSSGSSSGSSGSTGSSRLCPERPKRCRAVSAGLDIKGFTNTIYEQSLGHNV